MTKKRFRGIALALALALEELAAGLGYGEVPAEVLENAVEVATQVLEEVFADTAFDRGKFKSAVLDEFGGGLWKGGDSGQ